MLNLSKTLELDDYSSPKPKSLTYAEFTELLLRISSKISLPSYEFNSKTFLLNADSKFYLYEKLEYLCYMMHGLASEYI
jgi:hypothetical protein